MSDLDSNAVSIVRGISCCYSMIDRNALQFKLLVQRDLLHSHIIALFLESAIFAVTYVLGMWNLVGRTQPEVPTAAVEPSRRPNDSPVGFLVHNSRIQSFFVVN